MRLPAALAIALALASFAEAQEGVRLRSGRFLAGAIQIDEADKDGFRVERWDTGGIVYVRWVQIPEPEKNRLLGKTVEAAGPAIPLIDGVKALTESRTLIGVLVKQDAGQLLIKIATSPSPVPVPRSALSAPLETAKIPESEAYSPEEMIKNREDAARDCAALLKAAEFAGGLRKYTRAKEIYAKAAAADPSRKAEIDPLIASSEELIKEEKAADEFAKAKESARKFEFAAAIEMVKKALADYADTEAAKQNAGLAGALEGQAKEWEAKKADVLQREVPARYKAKRSSLISEYSRTKYKLSEARTKAANIDKEVVDFLIKDMNAKEEEIAAAWGKREQKQVTVSYGSGSWIVKGGQDGGLDTDAKTQPKMQQQNQNNNPFMNRQNPTRQNQQQKPKDLGKKLQTSEEWWTSASSSERTAFVQAEYANSSSAVTKTTDSKKCKECNGAGTLSGVREGVACEIKCARCHATKDDVVIQYW